MTFVWVLVTAMFGALTVVFFIQLSEDIAEIERLEAAQAALLDEVDALLAEYETLISGDCNGLG